MIQTNVFVSQRSGVKRLIEQKATRSPSGSASTRVIKNIVQEMVKPSSSLKVTTEKLLNTPMRFISICVARQERIFSPAFV